MKAISFVNNYISRPVAKNCCSSLTGMCPVKPSYSIFDLNFFVV